MENLLAGLELIFFEMTIVDKENNQNPVLVFAVACSIVGAAAVILDLTFYFLRGRSLLELKHGKSTLVFLVAWSLGALIIGWAGQMAKIFEVSVTAAVTVGFAWPLIFTRYMREKALEETQDEPEQNMEEEK
ncbi:hypothetical protein L2750_12720 [Shewanella submarina]|nr:hypothetical protein [Shewanella submarina]MCL1038013.1 hypothetical protein [Shewanella submarina]